jgi:hypothetical protein
MAELEVVKHTKKIYHIFGSNSPTRKKLKEFLLEIFIIVFAVSITIWFHDMAEHRHEQKEVREFLIGLKNDLKNDLTEMQSDRAAFKSQQTALRTLATMYTQTAPATDSLRKYINAVFNQVELLQNSGRYEGFKSSGKLGNIEDTKLQNDILDLYQEMIPSLLNTTRLYNSQKDRLIVFIEQHARIDDKQQILLFDALKNDEARIICSTTSYFPAQVIQRYDSCIKRIDEIVGKIDEVVAE